MERKLSIRKVQDLLRGKSSGEAGEILSGEETGSWCGVWYDWFCSDSALINRGGKFKSYILGLEGDFIDTHYLWLKNNCPIDGDLYDDIRISPFVSDDEASYNIGFSWGNGDTRQREVFDTRNNEVVCYEVKNSKEAYKLVNKLLSDNY